MKKSIFIMTSTHFFCGILMASNYSNANQENSNFDDVRQSRGARYHQTERNNTDINEQELSSSQNERGEGSNTRVNGLLPSFAFLQNQHINYRKVFMGLAIFTSGCITTLIPGVIIMQNEFDRLHKLANKRNFSCTYTCSANAKNKNNGINHQIFQNATHSLLDYKESSLRGQYPVLDAISINDLQKCNSYGCNNNVTCYCDFSHVKFN